MAFIIVTSFLKILLGFILAVFVVNFVRFWVERKSPNLNFFYVISLLVIFVGISARLKIFDSFLIFSCFPIAIAVELVIAKVRMKSKFEILNIAISQKIYDILDRRLSLKPSIKFNPSVDRIFTLFVFLSVVFLGLLLSLANPVLGNLRQNEQLIKVVKILKNEIAVGVFETSIYSIVAFFSSVFGMNQYVAVKIFGAINLLFVFFSVFKFGVSVVSDEILAILGSAIFTLNLNVNDFTEVNSFIFSLGLLSLALSIDEFRKGQMFIFFLGITAVLLVDLFTGITFFVVFILGYLFMKFVESFKAKRVNSVLYLLTSLLIIFAIFFLELYFRNDPLDFVKFYAIIYSETATHVPDFVHWFSLFSLFIASFLFYRREGMYGIFLLLLLILNLIVEIGALSIVSVEQLRLFTALFASVSGVFAMKEIFAMVRNFVRIISAVFILIMIFIFAWKISRIESGKLEPSEFVENILRIQRIEEPFKFAIVSHYGTKSAVENFAWFMDWEYFLKDYIYMTDVKKLYKKVYVFVPTGGAIREIHSSFVPRVEKVEAKLDSACRNYPIGEVEIFFDGVDLRVYKLTRTSDD